MNGEDLQRILEKLDRLTEGQAELKATVDVSLSQHKQELSGLWRRCDEHRDKQASLERDQVRRPEMVTCQDQQRKTTDELRRDVARIREEMAPLVAGAVRRAAAWTSVITAVVVTIVQWVFYAFVKGGPA